ncbi:nuclear transport factor 2 family protein [Streptomyces sp. NPDC005438]|uniref:nuclear transport factor 2 family protein n=1 Tax=Streptomyces sp. NPDC005438 TaxID=3156880 RepID=UPI0033B073CB
METIARNYLDTWNASGERRRQLLAEHWSEGATYTDPLAEVSGRAEIDGLVEGVRTQFPGFVFAPLGDVDGHHRQLRFRWGLGPEGAEPVVIGFDVVVVDSEGKIADVRGFLDRVPS